MKTVIYIRHGQDKRSRHKHDEKLTREGKKEVRELTSQLIEKYGVPDIIYTSPFRRTRETLKEVLKVIDASNKIEPRLGRFFTKKQSRFPEIRESTEEKGAIVLETKEEFRERVESHLNEVLSSKKKVVWNITHTLVLLHVAKIENIPRSPYVEYLDTVILQK